MFVRLFVDGKVEMNFSVVPCALNRCFQNVLTNGGSRSETLVFGSP